MTTQNEVNLLVLNLRADAVFPETFFENVTAAEMARYNDEVTPEMAANALATVAAALSHPTDGAAF